MLTDRGARLDGCVELVGRPRWPADDPKARPDRIRPREAPPRPGCATAPGARPKSVPGIPGLLAEIHLGSRDASPARRNPHELNPREPISRNELFTGKAPGSAGGPRRVVCCASSRLLRSFTLRCASSSRTAEGQEAQQKERGAADAGADGPAVIAVHGVVVPLASSVSSAPPVSPGMRTDRRTAEATAGVRHEKWRSGRIVPSRTRLHH